MRGIFLVVLCVVAVTYCQNRGSRRFTPSPFLEGQDLGFLPFRRTTTQSGSGRPVAVRRPAGWPGATRRRPTTPLPQLGANDIDAGFGVVSAVKESSRRVPAVAPERLPQRQPQRTRTSVRRRRPTRVQAVEVSVPEVTEKVIEASQTSITTTARPARLQTTLKASESSALSLQQQVEVLKKQARPSFRRRFKGRRVKKIRRIINPEEHDDDDDDDDDDDEDTEEKELKKSEEGIDDDSEVRDDPDEDISTTATQKPIVLRKQKRVFRGRGQQRGRGRTGSSRRQFSSRRRVTQAPPTATDATIADPTTAPTVSIATSSPFEPFPLGENEVDSSEDENAAKSIRKEESEVTVTKLTISAEGSSTGTSSPFSSSSSASASAATVASNSQLSSGFSFDEGSSANEVESSALNEIGSSEKTTVTQVIRRPTSRGSARGSSTFSRTTTRQGASRGSGRGRARGSGRQRVASSSSSVTSSSSSSNRGTSRRQFARRRRPSASTGSNAVTTRTPVTTATAAKPTTAAAFADIGRNPATEQTFKTDVVTSTNSLESGAPSRDETAFGFGPTTVAQFPTVAPVTSFGGFQPVTSSGSFRFGSDVVTRLGATPRPVSPNPLQPVFTPTTPAVSTQFFGGSFGQSTPASTPVSNAFIDSDLRQTPAPEPVTFFSTGPQGSGSGRPTFGSFSFGTNSVSGSSGSNSLGAVSSFNSIAATTRPVTFRPTAAKNAFTDPGLGSNTAFSSSQQFGSQPVATSNGFHPISFSTRNPAHPVNTRTENNVLISSNGAFSFGTGLASPQQNQASGSAFGTGGLQTTAPSSTFPKSRPFTTSHSSGPTSSPARAPAVLKEAARFFGSQPGSTVHTTFGAAGSSEGAVSSFSHSSVHPAPGSSGSFSFGSTATEASTLVNSVTSPATSATTTITTRQPQTFQAATERPTSNVVLRGDQTFVSRNQQQISVQKPSSFSSSSSFFSSSPSSSSTATSGSGRSSSSGRSFGSTSSSNSAFNPGRVTGFEFQQENGVITRSSHLRGFDTRLPTFHENVVISDPVFSSKDIKPGFTCEGRPYGYYADEANDCRIFHICQPVDVSSASTFYTRYSFFCGSETRFDQSKLSCLHDKDAMPCTESGSWLFRNNEFGVQEPRTNEQRFQQEVQGAAVTV